MNNDKSPFEPCHNFPTRRVCMLMVTHGCNLNCTYCYERFKNPKKQMDVELAKEIILKEIDFVKKSSDFSELEIQFMGGEPLLRFDLIKEIVEWMETHDFGVPYICFSTTNGTLLNEEKKAWFAEHKHSVVLSASFDGIESSQVANRGEKSQKVDWEYFNNVWPTQGFKMTISKESLCHLYDSYVYTAQQGFNIEASLAQGVDWDIADAELFYHQLSKLKDFYLQHNEYTPSNLLTRSLMGIGEHSDLQTKFCGSGTNMVTYDVDGKQYGCHMFTPLVLGNKAFTINEFNGWSDEASLTDESCNSCIFGRWCPTCIGFNQLTRGNMRLRDKRWCCMVAVNAIVACNFQLEYLSQNIANGNELNEVDASILQHALKAYDYLCKIDYKNHTFNA